MSLSSLIRHTLLLDTDLKLEINKCFYSEHFSYISRYLVHQFAGQLFIAYFATNNQMQTSYKMYACRLQSCYLFLWSRNN